MKNKRTNLILIIILILSIQILLLVNNRQRTSFRYFLWNIEDVSIGRLIIISYVSGLFLSTLLNETLNNSVRTKRIYEEDDISTDDDNYSVKTEDNDELYDIAPERDLRDPQPTISVNYRVIKENDENKLNDKKQTMKNTQSNDDWNNNGSEW